MLSSLWKTKGRCDDDAGYATVATAGFAAALVLLCGVIAWHAGSVVATAQAQRAADLAAVAGAYRFTVGEGAATACVTALQVAEHNDARIKNCDIAGEDVIVEAEDRGHTAWARAGPL